MTVEQAVEWYGREMARIESWVTYLCHKDITYVKVFQEKEKYRENSA